MTQDQIILFAILGGVLGLLLWGRIRYDLVAFGALLIAVILGVVADENAFSGFGHPATIIVAVVLVVSRGLLNSGAIDLLTRGILDATRSLPTHIGIMSGLAAGLSAVMNNVAALALLMPVEIENARKAGRSVSLTLMPLSFATILGGLITLIGTPPNIIVAQFREDALGAPFSMFDFTPVGLACAIGGVVFVALVGWRLLPEDIAKRQGARELFELEGYIAELTVEEKSEAIGRRVRDLDVTADEHDVTIVGLIRNGRRMPGQARIIEIRKGDQLVVEANARAIADFSKVMALSYAKDAAKFETGEDMALMEATVPYHARIEGRSAADLRLRTRHGVVVLGVARSGKSFRERLRKLIIQAGDIILFYGPRERIEDAIAFTGALPLADRGLKAVSNDKARLAIALFAGAIALATLGFLSLPIALSAVAVLMVLSKILPLREVYESIEWPVIVLLGSLIPIGAAFEQAGGTALIAGSIVGVAEGAPAWFVLGLLLVVTMTLSDVLNNTATTIIAAPVAVDIARLLDANPDPFLMAVAIGASCAFLTPIGHKNNTLIMGPGGYAFGDYWRMGLPLEVVVTAIAIPAILIVWPL